MNKKIHFLFFLGWGIWGLTAFYSAIEFSMKLLQNIKFSGFGALTACTISLSMFFLSIVHFLLWKYPLKTSHISDFSISNFIGSVGLALGSLLLIKTPPSEEIFGGALFLGSLIYFSALFITAISVLYGMVCVVEIFKYKKTLKIQSTKQTN